MAYLLNQDTLNSLEVAIIGMSGRFPGADSLGAFWNILVNNQETIAAFAVTDITDPTCSRETIGRPEYVRARGALKDVDCFDATLFGYTPNEARLLDPQIRFFHECVWEALEDAGYDPFRYPGAIGLFAGAHKNVFWELNGVLNNQDLDYCNKDLLALRVSYKLNLRGPSQNIYTACSTGLAAVHAACRSLLNGECSVAVAGAVSIETPQNRGYVHQPGGILSATGHNKSFDAGANGTVFSNGAGVVVLKLLEDAVKENDNIHAVIKGSALNNDGSRKVSFTAPSIKGQVDVIRDALTFSGEDPQTLSYVEAHGSATAIGDPIELEALKQAFGPGRKQFCGVGSVKSNIGHTNAAAGIAGLLKTVLALKHRLIPASIGYEAPNPNFSLENSPFFVVAENRDLKDVPAPLKMGVTSLGVGGTNVHLILEEAPAWQPEAPERKYHVLTFSAKTATALRNGIDRFSQFFTQQPPSLADAAYSLGAGRAQLPVRAAAVCSSVEAVQHGQLGTLLRESQVDENKQVTTVFAFAGLTGCSQVPARGLYAQEPGFREVLDGCFQTLNELTGLDFNRLFAQGAGPATGYPGPDRVERAIGFSVQYALGSYLAALGIAPDVLLGYGTGEKVAACLAGAVTPAAALASIVNGQAATVDFQPVRIPYLSGLTGTLVTGTVDDPHYFAALDALDPTPEAATGQLLALENALILVIGPENGFPGNIPDHPDYRAGRHQVLGMLPGSEEPDENLHFTRQLAAIWLAGKTIDWTVYYQSENRRKISLPAYAFDQNRYGQDALDLEAFRHHGGASRRKPDGAAGRAGGPADWLYYPSWTQILLPPAPAPQTGREGCWLVLGRNDALTAALAGRLREAGRLVVVVQPGETYGQSPAGYRINCREAGQYERLMGSLAAKGVAPNHIVHLWNLPPVAGNDHADRFASAQDYGYYSLVYLGQALAKAEKSYPVSVAVVTTGLHSVTGAEQAEPEKATLLGPLLVIPHENPRVRMKNIDFDGAMLPRTEAAVSIIVEETAGINEGTLVAYRNERRWVQAYQPYQPPRDGPAAPRFRDGGTYVILGGLGNIGIHVAHWVARHVKANLVLVNRSAFPGRSTWQDPPDGTAGGTARKMELLREIEQNGSRVDIRQANLADARQMGQLWQELTARYGRIDGVVQAAGVINTLSNMCPLEMIDRRVSEEQFAAKVYGSYVLEELFGQHGAPDFCILMSSLASVLGGIGFSAYAAANLYLDHLAKARNGRHGVQWLAINWDAWEFAYAGYVNDAHAYQLSYGIPPEEALEAFRLALAVPGAGQVIVSSGDLEARRWRYRELDREGPEEQAAPVPAEADYEPTIAALWKKHLGHQEIGLHDDFFKLGGDSLMLVAVVNDLARIFNRKITTREFYQHAQVSALARLLRSKTTAAPGVIQPAGTRQHYPLSAAQQALYYHYALEPERTSYNETKVFELAGAPDPGRLEEACRALIRRHESLRTSIHLVDGEPVQVVHDEVTFHVDYFREVSGTITGFAGQYVRPFDLGQAPLFRVAIVHTAAGRQYMVADFHHIICDAVSFNIIRNDLLGFYNGLPIRPLVLQCKDAAVHYRSEPYQQQLLAQKAYWLEAMRGIGPPARIPFDFQVREEDITEEGFAEFAITGSDFAALKALAETEGISLFSCLAASLAVLVLKYAGVQDITLGVPASGRNDPGLDGVVGMFVNVMPLRSYPGPEKSFRQYLKEVHTAGLELTEHQQYPYADLVNALKGVLPAGTPLYGILFNMLSRGMVSDQYEAGSVPVAIFGTEVALTANRVGKHPFIFNATEEEDQVRIGINYSPQQYAPATIRQLLEYYGEVIRTVSREPGTCLGAIRVGPSCREAAFDAALLDEEFDF